MVEPSELLEDLRVGRVIYDDTLIRILRTNILSVELEEIRL